LKIKAVHHTKRIDAFDSLVNMVASPLVDLPEDDEEILVRQVIAESPVVEVGVRDEWNQKVGWHRKENVLLRSISGGSTNNHLRGGKPLLYYGNGEADASSSPFHTRKINPGGSSTETIPWKVVMWIGIAASVLFVVAIIFHRVLGFVRGKKLRLS
jgi:hypothetical protein